MAKKKQSNPETESDSSYFLKLLLYFLVGTIWVRVNDVTVFPLGLVLGIIFASHEHFRIDRKIEYVVLLFSSMLGLIGYGFFLTFRF